MKTIRDHIRASSIGTERTIREAMEAIGHGMLGVALLVDTDGRFVGLVTDGDIRRALLGGTGLEAPIVDVPRPDSVTGRIGMTTAEVALLFSNAVRLVPLLDDDGRVVDLALAERRGRLPVAEPTLGEKELEYVSECVVTGWVSSAGSFVTRFEEMFAEACQVPHAIAVSNCTAALHLAAIALGLGPGDEVLIPSMTFISSANAVRFTGAQPVFVDVDPTTWNLDLAAVEAAITPATRAIMPVHLYGNPCDMDGIRAIADRHGLAVIEDAAEAQDAEYRGAKVGGLSDIGAFSFFGNKIITTGEGGMVVTQRDDLAATIRLLRDHGMSKERRYWHPVLGYNYRLTNVQAALGVAQMERLPEIIAAKRRTAEWYREGLDGVRGITLPVEQADAKCVYWMYTVLVDEREYGMSRDALMDVLKDHGVETRPMFPPCHLQPVYGTGQQLPVAERLGQQGLSLPSFERLQRIDVEKVVKLIRTAGRPA